LAAVLPLPDLPRTGRPTFAIEGSGAQGSIEHLNENAAAGDITFDRDTMETLDLVATI
jgi:hypothetical protein